MKPLRSMVLIAGLTAILGGCAWNAPMSEVTGNLYSHVNKDMYATGILAIDGEYTYYNPTTITPGRHVLRVQGLAPNWADAAKELTLDAEPCKRYYIAGYRVNPVTRDWEPKVDVVMPISGCPAGGGGGGSTNRY
ncbi:MAG TPA: hypothetical protein VMK32_11845 [Burkholderiaceae bacterium]|nr:hypothetical protein [Burkholderiaceae bacterium]